jgi:hypothetical protein
LFNQKRGRNLGSRRALCRRLTSWLYISYVTDGW